MEQQDVKISLTVKGKEEIYLITKGTRVEIAEFKKSLYKTIRSSKIYYNKIKS